MNALKSRQHLAILSVPLVFLLCSISPVSTVFACNIAPEIQTASPDDIKTFFDDQNKVVVTFVGYSGAGYENKTEMLENAASILDEYHPSQTIVNIGATPEGIGAIYELAKEKGFTTTGVISTQAKKYDAQLSSCVDYVFYVQDAIWGGFIRGTNELSPTSTVMVENSSILIGIGGGEVARDELIAANRFGKHIRFIPAEMNHNKALKKAKKNKLPKPTDFSGAADKVF